MTRILAVLIVGMLLGMGYSAWQYCGPCRSGNYESSALGQEHGQAEPARVTLVGMPSGENSPDERLNETDSEVTPDQKAAGAAAEKESTSEEKEPADEEKKASAEEKIKWGEETRGQVANLRALKTEVKSGEPIEFEIRVKNVSDKDVYLPSGRADEKMSPCFWTFHFDQWEWRSPHLSARNVPLKPGETVTVRCLVATSRDGMTAEQAQRFFHAPFRHLQNKNESDRLPAGSYRVHAIHGTLDDGLQSNPIEVQILDGR